MSDIGKSIGAAAKSGVVGGITNGVSGAIVGGVGSAIRSIFGHKSAKQEQDETQATVSTLKIPAMTAASTFRKRTKFDLSIK